MFKTSARALLSVAVTGREEFNGNRNQRNSLSTMKHSKGEIGRRSCSASVGSLGRILNGC